MGCGSTTAIRTHSTLGHAEKEVTQPLRQQQQPQQAKQENKTEHPEEQQQATQQAQQSIQDSGVPECNLNIGGTVRNQEQQQQQPHNLAGLDQSSVCARIEINPLHQHHGVLEYPPFFINTEPGTTVIGRWTQVGQTLTKWNSSSAAGSQSPSRIATQSLTLRDDKSDPQLSRTHALITHDGDHGFTISDASQNGTCLNGVALCTSKERKPGEPRSLKHGDVIQLQGKKALEMGVPCYVLRFVLLREDPSYVQWKLFDQLDMRGEIEVTAISLFLEEFAKEVSHVEDAANLNIPEMIYPTRNNSIPNDLASPKARRSKSSVADHLLHRAASTCTEARQVFARCVNSHSDIDRNWFTAERVLNWLHQGANELRKLPSAVDIPGPSATSPVTVVGDLHGNMQDLAQIVDIRGWPSQSNRFVFDGDFVDRGKSGLEVVIALITMLLGCEPGSVILVRGNHEDSAINSSYGFATELKDRFSNKENGDDQTWKEIYQAANLTFQAMPLCTRIGQVAVVFHGGPPRPVTTNGREVVTWERLMSIERTSLGGSRIPTPGTVNYPIINPKTDDAELANDMMWSDPRPDKDFKVKKCWKSNPRFCKPEDTVEVPGLAETAYLQRNVRGGGFIFSAEMAQYWMNHLDVKYIVRAHELQQEGFNFVETSCGKGIWTVFSAANYQDHANRGAVLVFSDPVDRPKPLVFDSVDVASSIEEVTRKNNDALSEAVFGCKSKLMECFGQVANPGTTLISEAAFCKCMDEVLGFDAGVVAWDLVLNQIWPEITESQMVDYDSFMSNYIDQEVETKSVYGSVNQQSMINVFNSLDADHGGLVSRQEWIDGCNHMNNKLGDAQKIDPVRMFEAVDLDGSGSICINELLEVFRLSLTSRSMTQKWKKVHRKSVMITNIVGDKWYLSKSRGANGEE